MKVIGAGFGRTGTASLKQALEILGYGPCYHMSEVIAQPHRVRQWLDVGEGRSAGWDTIFAGYASTLDWPAAAYWRELAEHYPDAKVVLTVRDAERWYDSVSATIFASALAERRPLPPHRRIVRKLVALRAPTSRSTRAWRGPRSWTASSTAASTTAPTSSRSSNATSPR
ncbi:sulfotransferase family protein [Actinomadura yumaensis]|uniref:sulfotransferase family protein n=1 Tax=Actinomadura yumaensis TaxID=111807 RepID=UPI003623A3F5